jgi:hypothetical protein
MRLPITSTHKPRSLSMGRAVNHSRLNRTPGRSGRPIASTPNGPGFIQAVTLEHAVQGIKQIKYRHRVERAVKREAERREEEKAKITLSPALDAWLKKEVP